MQQDDDDVLCVMNTHIDDLQHLANEAKQRKCRVVWLCNTNCEHMFALAALITENLEHFAEMWLQKQTISQESLLSLFEALQNNDFVQIVNITDVAQSCVTMQSLRDCLIKNQALIELDLSNCGMNDEMFALLCTGLQHNASLQVLALRGNHLGNTATTICLQQVLQQETCQLQDLFLSFNQFDDASMQLLVPAMLTRHTIRTLDLECNSLGNTAAELLYSYALHGHLHTCDTRNNATMQQEWHEKLANKTRDNLLTFQTQQDEVLEHEKALYLAHE